MYYIIAQMVDLHQRVILAPSGEVALFQSRQVADQIAARVTTEPGVNRVIVAATNDAARNAALDKIDQLAYDARMRIRALIERELDA